MPRITPKTIMLPAIAACAALALSGCTSTASNDTSASDDPVSSLRDSSTLSVCTEAQYAPFETIDGGDVVGIDADIAKQIAKDLGVEASFQDTPFEGIQSGQALDGGQCDIALSAITITDERATKMDFSDPYFKDNLTLTVRKDSGITSLDDVKAKGLRLVVQQGTTGEQYAADQGIEATQLEDAALAAEQVANGSADALLDQIAPTNEHLKEHDNLERVQDITTDEEYGVAVRKGNQALLGAVNSTIGRISSDGTLDSILSEWGAK